MPKRLAEFLDECDQKKTLLAMKNGAQPNEREVFIRGAVPSANGWQIVALVPERNFKEELIPLNDVSLSDSKRIDRNDPAF